MGEGIKTLNVSIQNTIEKGVGNVGISCVEMRLKVQNLSPPQERLSEEVS
jgi:hypothetical protein